jgi:dTDP-4-dehydrorhamnose reductase
MTALLVTGAFGQLGSDVRAVAMAGGLAVVGFGSRQLDITDRTAVDAALDSFAREHPTGVVVNAAAYTAVRSVMSS